MIPGDFDGGWGVVRGQGDFAAEGGLPGVRGGEAIEERVGAKGGGGRGGEVESGRRGMGEDGGCGWGLEPVGRGGEKGDATAASDDDWAARWGEEAVLVSVVGG